jgi:hypothetical protein
MSQGAGRLERLQLVGGLANLQQVRGRRVPVQLQMLKIRTLILNTTRLPSADDSNNVLQDCQIFVGT